MNTTQYPSALLENAVNEFSKLPGIGQRTALRLALYLLRQDGEMVERFGTSFIAMRRHICYCSVCRNISDTETCRICADKSRDSQTVCVVENVNDVLSIEETQQYRGVYHVLGGIISPMDGVGPADLEIESLVARVQSGAVREVIMALSPTMEGDTTAFYIFRKLADFDVKVTTIARGISIGDELAYADKITLGRSIVNRTAFQIN
ncbi:MAG: recombination mediator RecR [Prevotellaceae bacterium]|jgi:recombination protein RecR|nr:recombination mediator RecR [Prevotellaceae bacterium]